MLNKEHIVDIGLSCSILHEAVCECVSSVIFVCRTVLSISIVCFRVCKRVTFYDLC